MDGLIMAIQMILALSIIVGIHEFGHLIAAKTFGMKVEKYFIGFPPKIFSLEYKFQKPLEFILDQKAIFEKISK